MFAAMTYKLNDLILILVEEGGADEAYLTDKAPKGVLAGNRKGYLMGDVKRLIDASLNQKYVRGRFNNWVKNLGMSGISDNVILDVNNVLALLRKAIEFQIRTALTIPPQVPDLEEHGVNYQDIRELAKRIFAVAIADADYWEVCVNMKLPKGKKIKKDEDKKEGYFKRMAAKAA